MSAYCSAKASPGGAPALRPPPHLRPGRQPPSFRSHPPSCPWAFKNACSLGAALQGSAPGPVTRPALPPPPGPAGGPHSPQLSRHGTSRGSRLPTAVADTAVPFSCHVVGHRSPGAACSRSSLPGARGAWRHAHSGCAQWMSVTRDHAQSTQPLEKLRPRARVRLKHRVLSSTCDPWKSL